MTTTSLPGRRGRAAAVLAAVGILLGSGPAAAAPGQAAEPVVTVTASPGLAFQVSDCRGTYREYATAAVAVTVHRTGDTASALTVDLAYGGTLAAASGLPTQVTIPAGAAEVELTADEATSGRLTIAVVDGDGYAIAPPNLVETGVAVAVADLACGFGVVSSTQTIEVGTRPAAIDVDQVAAHPDPDLVSSVEGAVPPGTTYHPDGTWDGTATEVGDYSFQQYFCDAEGWCPNRADIRVIVVPAGERPPAAEPPPAAPAAAVAAAPTFTG